MNSVLPSDVASPEVAIAPRAMVNSSRRSRHQAALLSIGRRSLADREAAEIGYDVVTLVAKTLDTSLCALVEMFPGAAPAAVDRVLSIPPEAAHSGPKAGDPPHVDSLLSAALEKSVRVIVSDVQTDGRYRKCWCHRQGLRAVMAVPLVLHDQPLGALVVGSPKPGDYDQEDLMFLELVGNLLTAHMARAISETAVREEREYIAALLENTVALTVTMNSHGVVTRANRACLTLTGLRQDQVVGQPFWLSLCVPTEARLAEASFTQLSTEIAAVEFEGTVLTADGERRHLGWRMCHLPATGKQGVTAIATGVDMTRQRQAEQEARQAIVAAEATRRLVEELRTLQSAPLGSRVAQSLAAEAASRPAAGKSGAERRTSERKLFPYRQQIAPYENGIIPLRSSFTLVRCWDISAGGVSFLLDHSPTYKAVVVVLGSAASEVLMSAEVVRVTQIAEDGVNGFLVGCRFTGKL